MKVIFVKSGSRPSAYELTSRTITAIGVYGPPRARWTAFSFDLFRVRRKLSPATVELIHQHWSDQLNDKGHKRILRRGGYSCNYGDISFYLHVDREDEPHWRKFLTALLQDESAYREPPRDNGEVAVAENEIRVQ
jgi:hypothetical protein